MTDFQFYSLCDNVLHPSNFQGIQYIAYQTEADHEKG